ncbi:hypothetical protein CDD83_724 [Cordyceps sp. RAO-2017]|nr:hypothetical protein CDD83_724 [Cordyceps sp. RAO-2017]
MLSCFGCCGSRRRDGDDRQPLLPQYDDETALQTRLHEKLHTYQMLRAVSQGYMPSNEQVIVHLRSLLSADVLNPDMALSPSGRALVRTTKLWLTQLVDLLHGKNAEDQIQDFLWYLAKARADVDVGQVRARAAASKARADASATMASLRTVGSLLLTNSDFRLFLADLSTVGREVFRDAARTLADVSRKAGDRLEPSSETTESLKQTDGSTREPPSKQELEGPVREAAQVVEAGAAEVAAEAGHSLVEHMRGDEGRALVQRLKQTVLKLRQRTDYSESASTLSLLVKRYLDTYSQVAKDAAQAVGGEAGASRDADEAVANFWRFLTTLGDADKWEQVRQAFRQVVEAGRTDPDLDRLVRDLAKLVQEMLTKPEFFDDAEARLRLLRERAREITSRSAVADSVDGLLKKLDAAWRSVGEDEQLQGLFRTSARMAQLLSPEGEYTNQQLVSDAMHVFVPMAVRALQYVPVPRLEVSTPDLDLLLENLVLEPGRTVNDTSFLPYRLHVSTHNEVEVRKHRFRTTSSMATVVKVRIAGLSLAAEDVGYWVRLHSGLLRTEDAGLVSFRLDERGIDVGLELELGRGEAEGDGEVVSLRRVRVHMHRLDYTLRQSN